MKLNITLIALFLAYNVCPGQTISDSVEVSQTVSKTVQITASQPDNQPQNIADKLISSDQNLTIGGYGEVHYNQIMNPEMRNNGTMDVHRMVMFFGYNFSKRTQFVTELEVEHANEPWIEQLFLQHKLNNYINLKTGLLLIPMGIINEYHEPTTFNGVERPLIDSKISPTTWREVGIGFSGNVLPLSFKYQVYVVNGSVSYDGSKGLFNGNNGMRDGRQKGANSFMSSPNFTGKVEYYGLKGLNLGLSGYFGESQSKLYDKLANDNAALTQRADSSVVGISMIGLDARCNLKGLEMRGQLYYAVYSNTEQYNQFTQKSGIANDLGSAVLGYYIEAGYNVLRPFSQTKLQLIPFVRYQDYNTHFAVNKNMTANQKYKGSVVTTGITLRLAKGAVLKADIDYSRTKVDAKGITTFNAGMGIMF